MAIRYTVRSLPADFEAAALNDSGVVVGTRANRAVVWRNGRLTVLAGRVRDGDEVSQDSALGISSDGRVAGVVGWSYGEPFMIPSFATLWQSGKRFAAPRVTGFGHGVFTAVNRNGEAVGFAGTATRSEDSDAAGEIGETSIVTQYAKALYWDGKTIRSVGWGALTAINDTGATVGSVDGNAVFRPNAAAPWVKITQGTATGLSPKNLVCGSRVAGDSKKIQSQGTVGGKSFISYYPLWRGFLWSNGKLTDLPAVSGREGSRASSVNDMGMVVGHCDNGDNSDSVATLWRNGAPEDLNTLIPRTSVKLTDALAINARGQILVKSVDKKDTERYHLLLPVESGRPASR